MPIFSQSEEPKLDDSVLGADLGYRYPMGLDLRPASELHQRIVREVTKRARHSQSRMSKRYATWRELERTVQAYVPLDDEERRIKEEDRRKPVRIVIPFSYLMRDIIMTYTTAVFLERPYHRYEGVGPEDLFGAMLLEQVVDLQNIRFKNGLAYYIHIQDMLTYGFGAVTPTWEVETAYRTRYEPDMYEMPFGALPTGRMIRRDVEYVSCEGSKVHNIDPYNYYPDPNVPIHEVQRAEFVSWIQHDTYTNLMMQEAQGTCFNVRYLKEMDGRSSITSSSNSGREDKYGGTGWIDRLKSDHSRPVDKLVCYINLIPSQWGLGEREYPEKWMFVVAGDKVVIQAQPLNLNHNRFPVAVGCPNLDGYTSSPISALEIVFPLQEFADFMASSRMAAVRKSLHDMFLVNPEMVYMPDILNPKPAKVIRLRKAAWGQPLDNIMRQLEVRDVTSGHFADMTVLAQLIERVTGAVDILQGIVPSGSERRTAEEMRGVRNSAVSRLEKITKLISIQSMLDMGYFHAEHTQQFMSQPVFVRITGQWAEKLASDMGGRVKVSPWDLSVAYDIVPHDGTINKNQYESALLSLFQQAYSDPTGEIVRTFDMPRIFGHMLRLSGLKDVDSFKRTMPVEATVVPDETAVREAEAGNIVPMRVA